MVIPHYKQRSLSFKRDLQNIEVNKSAFKEGLGKEEDVKRMCFSFLFLPRLERKLLQALLNGLKIQYNKWYTRQRSQKIYN